MHDILETMKAEIEEGMEVLRPHYPKRKEYALRALAEYWRPHYYKEGHWPTSEEIEAKNEAKTIDEAYAELDKRYDSLSESDKARADSIYRTIKEVQGLGGPATILNDMNDAIDQTIAEREAA